LEKDLVSVGPMQSYQQNFKVAKTNNVYREKAFVSSEFKDYNPRVEFHVGKLVKAIRKEEGKEVDGSKIMENFVFDV
jgi:hypothetical protein